MTDPLRHLDAPSRRTIQAFLDAALQGSAEGMRDLFTKHCEFTGALSAGKLRGRQVIESHYRQAFKGISARGATVLRGVAAQDGKVVLEWEILPLGRPDSEPAKGRTILELDASGLIARIKTEWNPRQIFNGGV
ncbi:MAG TPA: nuclear transport factor 2 family protein [Geothrix sp.]|nr:nuclear transport factor 2 family protein [Geothrix sp.]